MTDEYETDSELIETIAAELDEVTEFLDQRVTNVTNNNSGPPPTNYLKVEFKGMVIEMQSPNTTYEDMVTHCRAVINDLNILPSHASADIPDAYV